MEIITYICNVIMSSSDHSNAAGADPGNESDKRDKVTIYKLCRDKDKLIEENKRLKEKLDVEIKKWEEQFKTFVCEAFDDKRLENKKRKERKRHRDEGTVMKKMLGCLLFLACIVQH